MHSNKHIKLIKKSGVWAVVTGATDGIGREYCRQLAKIGLNIFLISRDGKKLDITCNELKKCYKVEVKCFQADFTSNSIYEGLKESLKDLDIGVLVNNVGMGPPALSDFIDLDEKFSMSSILNCNILSTVQMTKVVGVGMCERKRGIIINISSASSLAPLPLCTIYSSTKSFLTQFSRSISEEMLKNGILVQTVRPFFVATKLIEKLCPPKFLTPSAEQFVESAFKTIGIERDTFGCLNHSIQGIITNSLPLILSTKLGWMVYNYFRCYLKRQN